MAGNLLVSVTNAANDPDRATVGFVVANASAASGVETSVFLSAEGVRLSQRGYADDIHEEGFAPLRELIDSFVEAEGTILVCSPCFKKRDLSEEDLVEGAKIVGGAVPVELMVNGASCITY